MMVSINGGAPKPMVYNGKSENKWMIWGYPYFRKPPNMFFLEGSLMLAMLLAI